MTTAERHSIIKAEAETAFVQMEALIQTLETRAPMNPRTAAQIERLRRGQRNMAEIGARLHRRGR